MGRRVLDSGNTACGGAEEEPANPLTEDPMGSWLPDSVEVVSERTGAKPEIGCWKGRRMRMTVSVLAGSIFAGNDPGMFAIGQLAGGVISEIRERDPFASLSPHGPVPCLPGRGAGRTCASTQSRRRVIARCRMARTAPGERPRSPAMRGASRSA